MNKLLKALLCAGLIFGLVGCGSSGGETEEKKEPENSIKANSEERQDLVIEESGYYLSSPDYPWVNYAVKVTNPNDEYYVAMPQLSVTSYDANGAVLGTSETILQPMEPGQTIIYSFQADCNQQQPANVEFKIINTSGDYSKVKNSQKAVELEASNLNITNDGYYYKLTGNVKNNSGKETTGTSMVFVVFYKEGKIVGGTGTYLSDMQVDAEMAFDITTQVVPDYDEIKVYPYAEINA